MRNSLFVLVFFAQTIVAAMVSAEPRIALVMGNGQYQHVSELDNPVSDSLLMAQSLEASGFEVVLVTDGDQSSMKQAIADFGRKLREAGPDSTGLFYYAGHGVQSQGNNYLLPVDGFIRDEADLDLVGVEAEWVLRQLYSARIRTSIVILDACRNNPFEALSGRLKEGLAEMKAPTGSFISYATAPGNVALDGLGANSPFTEALARNISVPNTPIEAVFKKVRIEVLEKTSGAQTPWDSSSLTGDFFFNVAEEEPSEDLAATSLWNSVKATGDSVQVMLFLRAYPDSAHSEEARGLLIALMDEELESTAKPEQAEVAAAPAAQEPDPRELELIGAAQSSGTIEDYEAYISEFPNGVFIDLAVTEIAALREKAEAEVASKAVPKEPSEEELQPLEDVIITFLDPLPRGSEPVLGNTIEQLVKGSPIFSPIEGLDEAAWKGQTCSNCHNWSKEALCEQGKFYLGLNAQRSLTKQHPYGGSFKQNLKDWAASGCQ